MNRRSRVAVLSLIVGGTVGVLPDVADALVRVRSASLSGTALRVTGTRARSNAVVTVRSSTDTVTGRAGGDGSFTVAANPFRSPDCRVSVDDGTGPVSVTLSGCTPEPPPPPPPPPVNRAPIASAGPDVLMPDVNGSGDELVFIDGQYSYDPDGSIVSYRWTMESTGALIGTLARMQVPFPVGTTVVRITVTDNASATATDTASITVAAGPPPDPTNLPPVAILGPDQVLVDRDNDSYETPIIDGLASFDPDGQIVRYELRILEVVNGPTYLVPWLAEIGLPPGTWTWQLRVFDNDGASSTDTMTVTVVRPSVTVSISGPSSVRRGDSVTWTVTVRNTGPESLSAASLSLTVAPSNAVRSLSPSTAVNLVTIAPGGSATARWTARAEAGGTIPRVTATLTQAGTVLASTTVDMAITP